MGKAKPKKLPRKPAPRTAKRTLRNARTVRARSSRPAKRDVILESWAAREPHGTPAGPVSVGQCKQLIDEAIDTIRTGRRPGRRSLMWKHFERGVIFECMVRIVVGGEPAQAVARHVCGVDDPEKDTEAESRAKRLQDLLRTLRRAYEEKYEEHRRGVEFARSIDECGEDLDKVVRRLNVKLAMRLDDMLSRGNFDELSTTEKQVLARYMANITAAREGTAKAGKDDATAERVQKLTAAESQAGSGQPRVSPEDQGIAMELLTRGILPSADAIAARKLEKAKGVAA